MSSLTSQFGNIDIYLFDQLLKGRFSNCSTIIDLGCGSGRNLHWFLQNDFAVYGIDADSAAIESVRELAQKLAPQIPAANFTVSTIEEMPFTQPLFDLAISNAVLHFAKDKAHFETMLSCCWQAIKPGGYFFCRLASITGIEKQVVPLGNGRYLLADGSERYLVNDADLLNYTNQLGGQLFEPIKTTNVQGMRCMTTWCMQKTTGQQAEE